MKQKQIATKILFILYCLLIVWIVIFKTSFSFSDIAFLSAERRVNLIPFYYADDVGRLHLREVILNIIIFIPFGLYLRMLDSSIKKAIITGAVTSLTLEVCQFILAIGSFDITDLITNTLGVIFGICFYALLGFVFKKRRTADKVVNILFGIGIILFLSMAAVLFLANN